MALHFSRDTKVYLEHSGFYWRIPVLDGFSFSQATNASEITLSEAVSTDGKSRRARQMFNDSYAPAEWSFQSYMRPNIAIPAEDALWASFFTTATYDGNEWSSTAISGSAANTVGWSINSSSSDLATLGTFNLWFVMGASTVAGDGPFTSGTDVTIYKIANCIPNEAAIDFDVDGIGTINWSGFGKIITDEASLDPGTPQARDLTSRSNYIRNRLTSLSARTATSALNVGSNSAYNLTLTGGNITFSNNITYLTPETLGRINQPLEHVTGTRSVTGNFTCYLGTGTAESADLFDKLIEATEVVTNSFELNFNIGGTAQSEPKVRVRVPNCHLEIPQHGIEDVISLDTTFHALPSDIDSANEVTITYRGATKPF